jgi:hypothetical protein
MRLAAAGSQSSAGEARGARAPRGARALCGWSPPPLPADTTAKRRADRVLVGTVPAVAVVAGVVALLNVAPLLPVRGELALEGVAALAAGGWCVLNFWRCRHAHCLATGPGWLALSPFLFTEAGLGRSLIAGDEQLVFLGILAAALLLEAAWYLARRTNAIGPRG